MTREELYASIYSHDVVYCPPEEEGCAMLEVALGCSWSKCHFCDFARDPFHVHSLEKIEDNLKVLGELRGDRDRVFFLGENVLCLSTEKLLTIMDMTKRYMPKVTSFAMYARFDDVLNKSEEELNHLKAAGLTNLHIGFESGSNSVLEMMNKGVNTFEMLAASRKLDKVGISYFFTVIIGLGGKALRNTHAIETGRLLSQMHPKGIWCLNLKVWPNTPLERMVKRGDFEPLTPWGKLIEERLLMENLNMQNECFYMNSTVLDILTIEGMLPNAKASLLESINRLLCWEGNRERYDRLDIVR